MNIYKPILLFLSLPLTSLLADHKENVVSQLLIGELEKIGDKKLPVPWVYSGEGGAIKYAELDLVGDERKEIIYDRTTRGELYKAGKPNDVYYQTKIGSLPVKIEGDVPLYGFHKKEGEKSIFMEASEGHNFDTADEKAFTRKLIIKEVTINGVNTQVHLIDANASKDLQEIWEATLSAHEQKSIKFMESRGFSYTSPKYSWVSLRDFVSGEFEWKDYEYSNWASLDEFSIESMTWKINKKAITPEFLELARNVRKLHLQSDMVVTYKDINLPHNYITPQAAYRALTDKMFDETNISSTSNKDIQGRTSDRSDFIPNRKDILDQSELLTTEVATKPTDDSILLWIIAGVLIAGILVFLLITSKGKSKSKS